MEHKKNTNRQGEMGRFCFSLKNCNTLKTFKPYFTLLFMHESMCQVRGVMLYTYLKNLICWTIVNVSNFENIAVRNG